MADPQHQAQLDFIDILSVFLYRLGIVLSAFTLCIPYLSYTYALLYLYMPMLAISAALMASSIHVYDKQIRWIIHFSAWLALMLFPLVWRSQQEFLMIAINALLFVTYSGVALKESFCFRLPGLKLVPVLLIISLLANWQDYGTISLLSQSGCAILFIAMSIMKLRMPLYYDIGDKSRYQI